jgi:DNA-binding LacI/PurR family transcriptional regulator
MVTIKDIAKEANVGYTAVSVVLGNRSSSGRVSDELRARIKDIAARMGYSRNAVATNMRSGKTKVIAFISDEISQEYASKVLDGASTAIDQNHFFLKLITIKSDDNFKITIERLLEQRPSGLILRVTSAAQLEFLSNIAKLHDIPIACVDNYSDMQGTINVFSDDIIGMQSVVEHLYSLGHQRIAHISNGLHLGFAARRYHGYCLGMKKCGLQIDDALLFEGIYKKKTDEFLAFFKKILSDKLGVTAVCTCSDFQAQAAMYIIQHLGKSVPEDISVTGYGALESCNYTFPPLTTIKQPFEKMGMAAANELIKAIRGESFESTVQIPTELVIKNSTGPAKLLNLKNRNQVKSE